MAEQNNQNRLFTMSSYAELVSILTMLQSSDGWKVVNMYLDAMIAEKTEFIVNDTNPANRERCYDLMDLARESRRALVSLKTIIETIKNYAAANATAQEISPNSGGKQKIANLSELSPEIRSGIASMKETFGGASNQE